MDAQPSGSGDVRNNMKQLSNKLKHKFDANNLRSMLREKCKIRIKEARKMRFDVCRASPEELGAPAQFDKEFLSDSILAELRELNANLNLEQEVMDEFFAESFDWAIKELENELNYYSWLEDPGSNIACPTCLIGALTQENGQMKCSCGLKFDFNGDPKMFESVIERVVSEHQSKCPEMITFFSEPNEFGQLKLTTICENCGHYFQI